VGHGPSSSHTIAPNDIAYFVYGLAGGVPEGAVVTLYNSFADTGEGHRTHVAVTAGLMGFAPTDTRVPRAMDLAAEAGFVPEFVPVHDEDRHVNAITIRCWRGPLEVFVEANSTGGGNWDIVEQRVIETAA